VRTEIKINDASVILYNYSLILRSQLSARISTALFDIIGERYSSEPSLAISISPAIGGFTRPHTRDEIAINRKATAVQNCAIVMSPAIGGASTYLDKFFGGYVAMVDKRMEGDQKIYSCQCHDYNSRLGSIKINKSYSGKTEAEIIINLFSTYWNEIDTSEYVDGTNGVPDIDFPDVYLSEALKMLADMFSKEFTIDYNKKLHYFTPIPGQAPFSLSSDIDLVSTSKLPHQVNDWSEDGARLINRVTVKGAEGIEVTRQDDASYAHYGEWYDSVHSDSNIDTEEWAEMVGDSILEQSAFEDIAGSFTIWQEGLVVGQKVNIQNDRWNIHGDYLIRGLELKMLVPNGEEIKVTVGDYHRDLVDLLTAINRLERL